MININRILNDHRLMRAVTGLSIAGFISLSDKFLQVFQESKQEEYHKALSLGTRRRALGGGAKGRLRTISLKLLFVLMYFKCYPTMESIGSILRLENRSNVKRNLDNLIPILEMTLGYTLSLPKRRISTLEEFLEIIPEAKDLFIDGTERPIQRPKDKARQRKNYSGKKKTHTKKVLIISDEKRRIGYLSPTRPGRVHDYSLFKDEFDPKTIPKDISLWMDKGFVGVERDFPGATVVMPKKKPKGRELTPYEREQNRIISGIRILSEHAIGGIKRLRIIADEFRNKSDQFMDKVMYLACGLWNYQLEYC